MMDPNTGQGFNAVEVGSEEYFDPNATDNKWPGILGLQMRVHHWWQGDVSFDTYESVGPVMAPYAQGGSITVSGPGGTTDLGVAAGFPPGGIDAAGNPLPNSLNDPNSTTPPPFYPGSFVLPGSNGDIAVPEGRPSACDPQLSASEHAIVIELHGCFGFPGGICKFPITPEAPGPDFPSNSHWYPDIVGMGEIVVPGYEKLETMGWQSFWPNPDGYEDYCCISYDELIAQGDPHDQYGPIANLIWTKRLSMVVRLVVGGSLFNDDVVITDFGYSDSFGDPNSVGYKITFKRSRSSSISTVANPDADIDQYSDIGQTIGFQQTPQQGTSGSIEDPSGDNTNNSQVTPTSPVTAPFIVPNAPPTVYPDEGSARQNIQAGIDLHPIIPVMVKTASSVEIQGGNIFHIFDQTTGETIAQVCQREGVTWDYTQIRLNPSLADKDPQTYNLKAGSTINLQLNKPAPPTNTAQDTTTNISPNSPVGSFGVTGLPVLPNPDPTRHAIVP